MEHIVLLLCILIFCCTLWYTKQKSDLMNPLLIFYMPLLLNILLYFGLYKVEYEITNQTLFIFLIGILGYFLGVIVLEPILNPYHIKCSDIPPLKINKTMKNIYLVFGTIGFIFGFYEMLKHGLAGSTDSFFTNVRLNEIFNGGNSALTKYSTVILHIGVCIYEYEYFSKERKQKKDLLKLFFFVFMLMFSVCFTMARTGLLQYSFSLIYIYLYCKGYKGKKKRRKSMWKLIKENKQLINLGILLVIVFMIIAKFTGRMSGTSSIFNKNFILYKYFGYSLVAFDKHILGHSGITEGFYVLGPFGKLLELFHVIDISKAEKIGASMNEFNVYSYISGPYMDFGILGLFITMFIIGAFVSILYNFSSMKGGCFTIFYSIYIYSIVIAFFAYQFSNTYYIYILALILILKLNVRRVCFHGLRRNYYSSDHIISFGENNNRNLK